MRPGRALSVVAVCIGVGRDTGSAPASAAGRSPSGGRSRHLRGADGLSLARPSSTATSNGARRCSRRRVRQRHGRPAHARGHAAALADPARPGQTQPRRRVRSTAVDGGDCRGGGVDGREPRQAEARFYLGGAYGSRVQWRVLRASAWGAARDGREVKEALDRTLALAPDARSTRSSGSGSTMLCRRRAHGREDPARPHDAAGRRSGPRAARMREAQRPASCSPTRRRSSSTWCYFNCENRPRTSSRCCASWSGAIRATRTSAAPSPTPRRSTGTT